MLSTEPFGDLARLLAQSIGKLLLGEAFLVHESFDLFSDGKREVDFGDDILRDAGNHLLKLIVDVFHSSEVFLSFISFIDKHKVYFTHGK